MLSIILSAVALVLGATTVLFGVKYRNLIKEIKEAVSAVGIAMKDGSIDEPEKDLIIKEALDVLRELVKIVW